MQRQVAVVGGGIVGLSCGIFLRRAGHAVKLLEKRSPGHEGSSSYGNAGICAAYEALSLNNPKLPFQLPFMLNYNDGPVSLLLNKHFATTTVPWGLSFLSNCTPSSSAATSAQLQILNKYSQATWHELLRELPDGLVSERPIMHATDAHAWRGLKAAAAKRKEALGVEYTAIDQPKKMKEEEPVLANSPLVKGLVSYHGSFHFRSPRRVMEELKGLFQRLGGHLIEGTARDVRRMGKRHEVVTEESGSVPCDSVVIACGAESKSMFQSLGICIPLDQERGYHIEFTGVDESEAVRHAVCWLPGKFFFTPMEGRLRVAGLTEFGGLKAPPNEERLDWLERQARRLIPSLPPRNRSKDWLGFRPSLPDLLPVISRTPLSPDVVLAFGHGHFGMTQGPFTGKLVSQMISRQSTTIDIHPFRASRF